MSWNSIVSAQAPAAGIAPADDATNPERSAAQPAPVAPEAPRQSLEPTSALALGLVPAPAPVLAPAPVAPAPAPDPAPAPALPTVPAAVPSPAPIAPAPAPAAPALAPLPSVAPAPAVAPAPEPAVAPLPAAAPVAPQPVVAAVEAAPAIVEAAPSLSSPAEAAADPAPVAEPAVAHVAAPAPAAPAPAPVEAMVPAVAPATQPNQSLNLPPAVVTAPSSAHQSILPVNAPARTPRKDRSGSIAKVGFFFLIVGALASAAVIFGRPYLFPSDWEANALEFAEPIEAARGTDFIEPVLLTSQPTATHRELVNAQLLGDAASNMPMWRALGLAGSDSTDDATLQTLISEQAPVLYSKVDGQVYYDASFTRSDRASLISRAMVTAALDQEFAFSADAPNRSLDDAAMTEANVRQQATIIAQTATSRAPLPNDDMSALAFLPSVLDYSLTAPYVYVDLLPPINDVAPNPLTGIGLEGPGPLRVPALTQIPSTSLVVGDTAVGSSVITDRSFWYMSFASHLDAATAYRMSNDLQSAGLQMVDGQTGRCAVATLAAADAATNAALLADLTTWVAAVAPELGATVTAMTDSSVQLRSCNPTGVYTSNMRFGTARQLIAWRAIELSIGNLMAQQGATPEDTAAAFARIGSTPSAIAAAQLPAGTPPVELGAAAETAATDVVVAGGLSIDPLTPQNPDAPVDLATADQASGEG